VDHFSWMCAISTPELTATSTMLEILSIDCRFRSRQLRLQRQFIRCGGRDELPPPVWTNLPAELKLDLVDTGLSERQDVPGIHRHFGQKKSYKILGRRLAEVSTGTFVGPDVERVRIAERAEDFLRDYRINGQASFDDAEALWRLHLEPFFGQVKPSAVTSDLLNRYVTGCFLGMFVSAVMVGIAQHQKLEYVKMTIVKRSQKCRLLASSATMAQTGLRDGRLSLRRRIEKLVMVDNVPSSSRTTVLIVDDHPITRAGLAAVLQTRPQYCVCGEASSVQEAVDQFDRLRPNITLMDLKLPDGYGVQAIRRIRLIDPQAKILVLTTYEGDEDIHQSLKAGAMGYLVKGASYETIFQALRKVDQGSIFLPQPVNTILLRRDVASLTARERQVLSLIVAGKSNREIGALLNIKEVSVKAHITLILSRLQVSDRTQAVVAALKRGLEHL